MILPAAGLVLLSDEESVLLSEKSITRMLKVNQVTGELTKSSNMIPFHPKAKKKKTALRAKRFQKFCTFFFFFCIFFCQNYPKKA